MKLPAGFLEKMNRLLGESEYLELLESYNQHRYYGLRVNTLKISVADFLRISPFRLEPVPWTIDGFYYPEGENPGRHPYYHAGLYYIQEPSAMLPGSILDAQPGERVLDLCAAPGGKTVQIAAAMKNSGILVANDINSDRVKALVKNIELCGVRNAVVLNETPERLAEGFGCYFDRVLVDAPCSGEGMFRKDEDAAKSWQSFKCDTCSEMQRYILVNADRLLKPGGFMVYSTCTFSPEEDEQIIANFLNRYSEYMTLDIPKPAGIEPGRPEWADGNDLLARTARLWPHRVKGEGHFVACLWKRDRCSGPGNSGQIEMVYGEFIDENELPEAYKRFMQENLNFKPQGCYTKKGRNIYLLPVKIPNLDRIKTAKFGWYLGEVDDNRFEPSHSLVTALGITDFKKTVNFQKSSREVYSYLKGETIMLEGDKGYTAVCVDGYTLGWAKQTGDMLKNLYPKGWRKMS